MDTSGSSFSESLQAVVEHQSLQLKYQESELQILKEKLATLTGMQGP